MRVGMRISRGRRSVGNLFAPATPSAGGGVALPTTAPATSSQGTFSLATQVAYTPMSIAPTSRYSPITKVATTTQTASGTSPTYTRTAMPGQTFSADGGLRPPAPAVVPPALPAPTPEDSYAPAPPAYDDTASTGGGLTTSGSDVISLPPEATSFYQKYKTPIWIGGALLAGLVVWKVLR